MCLLTAGWETIICVRVHAPAHVSQSFCAMMLVCRVATADSCGVVQLSPTSSAVVEVMNQLPHWGKFASLCPFLQDSLGCLATGPSQQATP